MTKPVDLIVANALHDIATHVECMPEPFQAGFMEGLEKENGGESIMRAMLCQISQSASLPVVRRLLDAVGAPHSDGEVRQRLQAVFEQRKAESGKDTGESA